MVLIGYFRSEKLSICDSTMCSECFGELRRGKRVAHWWCHRVTEDKEGPSQGDEEPDVRIVFDQCWQMYPTAPLPLENRPKISDAQNPTSPQELCLLGPHLWSFFDPFVIIHFLSVHALTLEKRALLVLIKMKATQQ